VRPAIALPCSQLPSSPPRRRRTSALSSPFQFANSTQPNKAVANANVTLDDARLEQFVPAIARESIARRGVSS
jgi:hypothetical protein